MNEETKTVRWLVYFSGDVQGVGFRYTAQRFARSLDLTGWVENLPDGRVRMEAQGSVSKLRKLIINLKSHPPIYIEDYFIKEIPVIEGDSKFSIKGW